VPQLMWPRMVLLCLHISPLSTSNPWWIVQVSKNERSILKGLAAERAVTEVCRITSSIATVLARNVWQRKEVFQRRCVAKPTALTGNLLRAEVNGQVGFTTCVNTEIIEVSGWRKCLWSVGKKVITESHELSKYCVCRYLPTDWLTDWLTDSWSRVLLEKLTVTQLVKFSTFMESESSLPC
jgi:hypothetical protein